ncbi:MAG: secretin and TonB N-terminal domain-containing protein [Geitlerinemataceae cyanobacterium]
MIPNPDIEIDGVPIDGIGPINPVPQFQPRAVAPPVGDIAISTTDVSSFTLNLRTAERVPRLVLREAPVEDVLALLARAAGLNLAYVAEAPGSEGPDGASARRTISLDVENEAVQDVFNNVLRLSGLQANLMGNTVVVGSELPDEARNVITRTLRLNQTEVVAARDFLLAHGAEAALISTQTQTQTIREGQQGELGATSQTTTTTRTRLEPLTLDSQDDPYTGYAALPLRGLLVSIAPRGRGIDEVANEISLTGDPRKVEIATQLISQLETRRRQVAVNVKIVDVSLSNQDNFNTSFSFGVNDTFVSSEDGTAFLNFGGVNPPSNVNLNLSNPVPPILGPESPIGQFPNRFLSTLEAQIVNGNAKILTDPTLVVQEGQTSVVSLVTEVVGEVTVTFNDTNSGTRETRNVEKEEVGLRLALSINQIDDNGFVTLNANPSVSAPVGQEDLGDDGFVTLIQTREVNSGRIRLRDNQTLVLSGIIQDSDRTEVRKVPILGDIPLLGALFRSTRRDNDRNEVIVILTPNILDDSDRNTFGYSYTPSREARDFIQQQSNFGN